MTRTNKALALTLLAGTCAAPMLTQTDCQRWLATYRAQILHSQAAKHLRSVRHRLAHKRVLTVKHYRNGHRMGPLQALHRFQLDCGDFTPTPAASVGLLTLPVDLTAPPLPVAFPDYGPPTFDFTPAFVTEASVPDETTPTGGYPGPVGGPGPAGFLPGGTLPVGSAPLPPTGATPEPGALLLVLTGCGLLLIGLQSRESWASASAICRRKEALYGSGSLQSSASSSAACRLTICSCSASLSAAVSSSGMRERVAERRLAA